MNAVTMKDIARLAGVSHSTVSRTLNHAPGVGPETRKRILEICRQYGYHVNQLGRSLSAGYSGTISCILPDLDNPLFAEQVLNLERAAQRRGYHIMVSHGRVESSDITQLFDFLIGHRVAGIILFSSSPRVPEIIHRYIGRVPIVLHGLVDTSDVPSPIPIVSTDNLLGGRMAAQYLYELGHRRVAYLGLRKNSATHILRHRGFSEFAEENGMSVRVLENESLSSSLEAGYRLAKQLFVNDFQETAIFAASDSISLGVMDAAHEFQLSIPQDVSLLGYDNIRYSDFPHIRLSTLDQRKQELMEAAVDCLLNLIRTPEQTETAPRLIPPVLQERQTCRQV